MDRLYTHIFYENHGCGLNSNRHVHLAIAVAAYMYYVAT